MNFIWIFFLPSLSKYDYVLCMLKFWTSRQSIKDSMFPYHSTFTRFGVFTKQGAKQILIAQGYRCFNINFRLRFKIVWLTTTWWDLTFFIRKWFSTHSGRRASVPSLRWLASIKWLLIFVLFEFVSGLKMFEKCYKINH